MPISKILDKNLDKKNSHAPIDAAKRQSLKTMTGTALIGGSALIGSTALTAAIPTLANTSQTAPSAASPSALKTQSELSVHLTVGPRPSITLTNNTNLPITVKHVYPGIVHAGRHSFDINEMFARFGSSGCTIEAGESRAVRVTAITGTQEERAFPRQRYARQPLRVAAVTGNDHKGLIVNSSRSFYA